jgi:quercetin dioxygenase-like cupin family protein
VSDQGASAFPDFVRRLPRPDTPVEALRAHILQGAGGLVMFYEAPEGLELPEHAHDAQWGVVITGRTDFTIAGEVRSYGPGETYHIPAGTPHAVRLHPGSSGIDVFEDPNRYAPKPDP